MAFGRMARSRADCSLARLGRAARDACGGPMFPIRVAFRNMALHRVRVEWDGGSPRVGRTKPMMLIINGLCTRDV
jgi:hypothetical protein